MYTMGLKQLIQTDKGKVMISVILGFGVATLFRKSCSEEECIQFKGPKLNKVKENIYNYDNQCYQFTPQPVKCSSDKKVVRFA
jgi:hypothetical protein